MSLLVEVLAGRKSRETGFTAHGQLVTKVFCSAMRFGEGEKGASLKK